MGSLRRLFRENTKTFPHVILHHVRDDSGFSRPTVGRYAGNVTVNKDAEVLTFYNIMSRLSRLITFCICALSVSDGELKRLKDAFKRSSTLSGYMTKPTFIREVLGDGVPLRLAEVSPRRITGSALLSLLQH